MRRKRTEERKEEKIGKGRDKRIGMREGWKRNDRLRRIGMRGREDKGREGKERRREDGKGREEENRRREEYSIR